MILEPVHALRVRCANKPPSAALQILAVAPLRQRASALQP